MSIIEPLVILTTGRAGSSLVAQIFMAHGCYTGDLIGENRQIKARMIDLAGFDLTGPIPECDFNWEQEIKKIIPEDRKWLSKHGSFFYKIWYQFDPIFVKTKRPLKDILDSYKRCGFLPQYNEKEREFIMGRQIEIMDQHKGIEIDTPELVSGRVDQIQKAIESYGLEYDHQLTANLINKDRFHV